MFEGLSPLARDAKAWPFEQARALLDRVLRVRLDSDADRDLAASLIQKGEARAAVERFAALADRSVLFETGYGPSGLPHIGTFGEVARTTMVRTAFRALTDDAIPTKLICFSDDMDGMRKVPPNLPNQELLAANIDRPLTVVPDPFGEHESFGHHNNARLRAFLDAFGFEYEFVSATDCYRSGRFDEVLLRALERFDAIQKIMLPSLGEERRATYSPFLPISPKTGKVLQVPTLEGRVETGTIVFKDEDGTPTEVPVTGGGVKMQWRPDWAMRWTALGVDYEMSGKDLIDSVRLSNQVCKVLGGVPPEGFNYELFMDENNQKISKTKGNGLTMEDWLRYGAPESLAYYMFQSPRSAKRLFFDVIPKASDEYLQQLDAYNRKREAGLEGPDLNNPVWHIHRGAPPETGSPVSFSLMLNLVSAANASDKAILWGFLSRYLPGATPAREPLLDRLADYAMNYYEDFVRPSKTFRAPDERDRAALADLAGRLKALPADADAETIQNVVFEVGKDAGYEPLRAWFGTLYEVLLGQAQGPRFGSFAAIFGLDRTVALIEEKLAG
jgi:lysyl-tRNA synthetase class 1